MSKLVSRKVISESRAKKLIPTLLVYGKDGESVLITYQLEPT
jgi:hypothetical protein